MLKTDDMYKLEPKELKIDRRMLRRIVRIGVPAGMQSVMYNISNIIVQAGVNTLGTDNVTAWATYGKVDGLYWMIINALGISATTFVGRITEPDGSTGCAREWEPVWSSAWFSPEP